MTGAEDFWKEKNKEALLSKTKKVVRGEAAGCCGSSTKDVHGLWPMMVVLNAVRMYSLA